MMKEACVNQTKLKEMQQKHKATREQGGQIKTIMVVVVLVLEGNVAPNASGN